MNKLIPEINNIRIKIFPNNTLIIENYQNLKEITKDLLIVDNYKILGEKLQIEGLNQFIIEVSGKIKQIVIE